MLPVFEREGGHAENSIKTNDFFTSVRALLVDIPERRTDGRAVIDHHAQLTAEHHHILSFPDLLNGRVALRELGIKPAYELKKLIHSFKFVVDELELDVIGKKRFGPGLVLLVNQREHIPEPTGHFVALYQCIVIDNLFLFIFSSSL
jgi:hypothetical protein